MDDEEKNFEEWKITRSTIVEFDKILLQIRALDITVTTVLLGAGFRYSYWLFFFAFTLNIAFFFLEIHYHNYLHSVAMHAIFIENKIGFKLTNVLDSTRNKYKKERKASLNYWGGIIVTNICYIIYFIFMIISIGLFIAKIKIINLA